MIESKKDKDVVKKEYFSVIELRIPSYCQF